MSKAQLSMEGKEALKAFRIVGFAIFPAPDALETPLSVMEIPFGAFRMRATEVGVNIRGYRPGKRDISGLL